MKKIYVALFFFVTLVLSIYFVIEMKPGTAFIVIFIAASIYGFIYRRKSPAEKEEEKKKAK